VGRTIKLALKVGRELKKVGKHWSSWNKFIAAIHAPTTFRMVFYTLCYYFWGQHCCLTETNILVKDFVFFVNLRFPQCLHWHLPYRCLGCYLCFI